MRHIYGFILLFSLCVPPAVNADVTIRYKMDFKAGALVPPGAVAQQGPGNQKSPFPPVILVQIKGDKGYSNASFGASFGASLIDFTKQEVTVMDPTDKLFSTVSTKDYWGELGASMPAMPAVPPAAQKILESIKADFSCRQTGRTDTIAGVQAEERECTLSIHLPVPEGLPLPPGMFQPGQNVTVIKLVMQRWNATSAEISRVPALGEWMTYSSSSAELLNPAASMQQALAKLPFIGQSFAPIIEELSKNKSAMMKMHTEIYMPVMAQIAPLLQAQGRKLPPGFDPNAPLAEIDTVVTELSSAAIDGSVFQVPSDYHATPLADLLKTLMPTPKAPAPPGARLSGRP